MADCKRGIPMPGGGSTGSVCRKPDLCRMEGRCNFVASVERYLERHNGLMPGESRFPRIVWHPGYDGYAWAI